MLVVGGFINTRIYYGSRMINYGSGPLTEDLGRWFLGHLAAGRKEVIISEGGQSILAVAK